MKPKPKADDAWNQSAAQEALTKLTPAQRKLWEALEPLGFWLEQPAIATTKNGGAYPHRFDFWHEAAKLAVEVDGGYHKRTKGRDRRRDQRFRTAGIVTIRVLNREVLKDFEGVLAKIRAALESRTD